MNKPLFCVIDDNIVVIKSIKKQKIIIDSNSVIKCISINDRSWMLKNDGKLYVTPLGKPCSKKYEIWNKNIIINEKIIDISAGNFHCLCLTETQKVYGWGINMDNSLNLGDSLGTIIDPVFIKDNVENIFCIENGNIITVIEDNDKTYYSFGSFTNIDYSDYIPNTMLQNKKSKVLSFGFSNLTMTKIIEFKNLSINFLCDNQLLKFVSVNNEKGFISKSVVDNNIVNIGNVLDMVSYRENILDNKIYNHNNYHCLKIAMNGEYCLIITRHINFEINNKTIINTATLVNEFKNIILVGFIKKNLYFKLGNTLYSWNIEYKFGRYKKIQ